MKRCEGNSGFDVETEEGVEMSGERLDIHLRVHTKKVRDSEKEKETPHH